MGKLSLPLNHPLPHQNILGKLLLPVDEGSNSLPIIRRLNIPQTRRITHPIFRPTKAVYLRLKESAIRFQMPLM
jgi:hypothetical protein